MSKAPHMAVSPVIQATATTGFLDAKRMPRIPSSWISWLRNLARMCAVPTRKQRAGAASVERQGITVPDSWSKYRS